MVAAAGRPGAHRRRAWEAVAAGQAEGGRRRRAWAAAVEVQPVQQPPVAVEVAPVGPREGEGEP